MTRRLGYNQTVDRWWVILLKKTRNIYNMYLETKSWIALVNYSTYEYRTCYLASPHISSSLPVAHKAPIHCIHLSLCFVCSICPCPAVSLFRQLILIRRHDWPWRNMWRAARRTNSRTIIDPWGITLSFIQIALSSNSTAKIGAKHQSILNNSWLLQ